MDAPCEWRMQGRQRRLGAGAALRQGPPTTVLNAMASRTRHGHRIAFRCSGSASFGEDELAVGGDAQAVVLAVVLQDGLALAG